MKITSKLTNTKKLNNILSCAGQFNVIEGLARLRKIRLPIISVPKSNGSLKEISGGKASWILNSATTRNARQNQIGRLIARTPIKVATSNTIGTSGRGIKSHVLVIANVNNNASQIWATGPKLRFSPSKLGIDEAVSRCIPHHRS